MSELTFGEQSALEAARAAQASAEIIAQAAQAAQNHAEAVAKAALAAQTSAEMIAEALKSSELRYRRLFETARDGILILDSQTGAITDANPFMAELLGYTHEELLGKYLWEIGLLRDKETSQEAFRLLQRERYIRYEDLPLQTRRGDRCEVEFVSNIYRENGHEVIQCNIRNITDRKIVEQELAAAARRNERIAETLQRSMLQVYPAGKFPGIDVETLYEAALNEAEVGGDFFDVFALNERKIALVVGDVSGKGLVAAARTAEVKYALRAFLHEYGVPEIALARLNDFIGKAYRSDSSCSETFVVLAVAVVDGVTGKAVFSSAGAEPTLILRVDGTTEQVQTIGTPLGIEEDATYPVAAVALASGDTVLMATDGITEARNSDNFLGMEGLARLAENAGPHVTLKELVQAVSEGSRHFAGGGFHDDACLLLARRQ